MSIFGRKAGAAGHHLGALEAARALAGLSTETIAAALTEHLDDGQLTALGEQLTGAGPGALAEAEAQGFRRGSQRAAELLAEADFEPGAAAELLGNPELDGLGVDSLRALAAHRPDVGAAEMLAALRADKTPPLGAGGGSETAARADDHGWSKARVRAEKAMRLDRLETAGA